MKRLKKHIFILLFLIWFLSGCTGIKPVFTHQWYDYYERALSSMEQARYQAALSDLKEAIKRRPDDLRMARTYGVGHLADYFPHREKGVVHYIQGDYESAEQELEISLRYEESQKALLFLDKTRTRLMQLRNEKPVAPRIILKSPSDKDEIWTRDDPVIISGIAKSNQYVSEITVANRAVYLEGSDQRIEFKQTVKLNQGTHEIAVTAQNLLKGKTTHKLLIHIDRSGPVIILKTFDLVDGLTGWLYDESEEIFLSADGKDILASTAGKTVPFSVPVQAGTQSVTLLASDKLGNETKALITRKMVTKSNFLKSDPILVGQNTSNILTDSAPALSVLNSNASECDIILNELSDNTEVFSEILSVRGEVRGKNEIKTVLINNTPVHEKPGRVIFFNHSVRLNKGENRIIIRAKDVSGKETIREILIIRKIPELFKLKYRCVFKANSLETYSPDKTEGNRFQPLFMDRLVERERFRLKLGDKLREITEMRRFDMTGASARFMFSGYIYKTKLGLEIVTEIVDVETSEVLSIEDVYGDTEGGFTLAALAGELSEKFHRAFPLLKGKVIQKDGSCFLADLETGGISLRWPLVVGSDTEFISNAFIHETKEKNCRITLMACPDDAAVLGKWVITQ
ncbi:tetratricopeptide repeat protein [Desulfonema magnum]|uniref:Tetratricopeptide repeat-containing n=1 Tax=Desulfonema magnum TaxID=45655 RepID=A0A975BT14_9BACT|nr:tetratricopeptide repeat protein [Desulfonema magnum]QTA90858.1 tetratricopeptide repeat-containing [Desulfonema magnum]